MEECLCMQILFCYAILNITFVLRFLKLYLVSAEGLVEGRKWNINVFRRIHDFKHLYTFFFGVLNFLSYFEEK